MNDRLHLMIAMNTTQNKPVKGPIMLEYDAIKASLPPGILLAIRLGDFLEFFGDDARRVAKLLTITLTSRQGTPMAGIPYHAVDCYTGKLLAMGERVAIANEEKKSLRTLNP